MSKKAHSKLWLYFTGVIFATIFSVFIFVTLLWFILYRFGVIEADPRIRHLSLIHI